MSPIGSGDSVAEGRGLPPIEEAAPGLWRIPLPIPNSPLRYVTVHALRVPDGVVLVDTGWNAPEVLAALREGLAVAGTSLSDVRGIVVSHIHPDHYGLASRIRDESGAWVAMHAAEAALITRRSDEIEDVVARIEDWLLRTGAGPREAEELRSARLDIRRYVDVPSPDSLLEDGDMLELDGWKLRAIHTPGHSPGHLCFYEEGGSFLLTGDHVLPAITPNVSFHPQSGPDPLGRFLASLRRLRDMPAARLALPSHGTRLADVGIRIDELLAHHEERLAEAHELLASGAETVWDVASKLQWSIAWDDLRGFVRRSALGEAHAHLVLLEQRGLTDRLDDRPYRWRVR